MYSPFCDKSGNPIELNKIRFSHLQQLKEIDEGYKIEYKRSFDKSVRDKIPSIIVSFANSEGGWLFIGIEDEDHDVVCIPKVRSDYSQTISQLLKEKTSPIPSFDSRFIRNPEDPNEGVLVIFVHEGQFPPYISNGTVYIRNGSSKEPIKSERATIDYLHQKAQRFRDKINEFCKRDIYFPNDIINVGRGKITYPICNIYFINTGLFHKNELKSYEDFNKLSEYVFSIFEGKLFGDSQYTFNSLVFRHKSIDPSIPSMTPTVEIFRDFSAKIHIPVSFALDSERQHAIDTLKGIGAIKGEDIKIYGGVDSFNCLFGILNGVAIIYDYYRIPVSDMAVCFEMENGGNAVLYFEGEQYLKDVKTQGIRFSNRAWSKSQVIFLRDYDKISYHEVVSTLAYNYFLAEFGFSPETAPKMVLQAVTEKYPDVEKSNNSH